MKSLDVHKNYLGLAIFFAIVPFSVRSIGSGVEFFILENHFELLFVFLTFSFIFASIGFIKLKQSQETNSLFRRK